MRCAMSARNAGIAGARAKAAPGGDSADATASGFIRYSREYIARLGALMGSADLTTLRRVLEELRWARDRQATVFIAGNGGSSATAAHWVNDLCKATKRQDRRPFRAMSLTDNVPWLTALANDDGYQHVFAGQLDNFAAPGDVLVVISASGNSPNLIAAVALARERGLTTIALLGFDGGRLKDLVDVPFWLPTEHGAYGLVETAHAAFADIVTGSLVGDLD